MTNLPTDLCAGEMNGQDPEFRKLNASLENIHSTTNSDPDTVPQIVNQAPPFQVVELRSNLEKIISPDLVTNIISIDALILDHNCAEIYTAIWCHLDPKSLIMAESASKNWRLNIAASIAWQNIIKILVKRSSIWRDLSIEREWSKYIEYKAQDISRSYFRDLYWNVLRDIKKLQNNWNFATCATETIKCDGAGEQKGIYCFHYTREYLYSGHRDHKIRIWDLATRELQATLIGHNGSVLTLRVQGSLLVSGSSDSSIRLWSLKSLTCIQVIAHHFSSVLHTWFLSDKVVSSSKDKTLAVWKLNNERLEFQACLKGHKAAVNAVEFDDKYIVSASGDSTIRIWRWDDYQCANVLQDHKRGIACINYKYPIVLSGSSDADIRIWDVEKAICIRVLKGHSQMIRCICFNDRHIISGSVDGSVKIWNLKVAMMPSAVPLVGTVTKHTDRVLRVQTDQLKFVSSSHDDTIIIWNFLDPSMKDKSLWRPKRCRNSRF